MRRLIPADLDGDNVVVQNPFLPFVDTDYDVQVRLLK